jgi:SUR7/PalI family
LGGLLGKGADALKNVGQDAVNAASGAVKGALDIKDFYSAHLMTFCEGDFKPDPKDPKASENVTFCSLRKPFFSFDPAAIIQSKLPQGVDLKSLNWPDEITNGIKAVNIASRAMFFFYIVGIGAAGIATISSIFGVLSYGPALAYLNLGFSVVSCPHAKWNTCQLTNYQLSLLGLGIGSAIATVIIFKGTDAINNFGGKIGLEAERGTTFLGMTWTATILMLLSTLGWVGEYIMGRRTSFIEEKYY